MVADKSNPPPVRESLVPGEEPGIDRVKLWPAWTRNAETQRAVLRRSTVVGVLAVAATLLQVGVAWYVLRRMDEVAHGAMVEVADMKGMLRASLTATTAVNAIEIEEKTSEMDALFAPEPAQEDPAAPGTVLYKPNAAREIVAKARRAERPRAYRAVGNILNKNRDLDLVPCHRVIRSDGSVGGYAFGSARKMALLRKEGAL